MGATAVAAVIAAKERQIIQRFRDLHATSEATARTLHDVAIEENVGFRALRRHEIIRRRTDGLYYLDEGVLRAAQKTRARVAIIIVATLLIIAAGVALGIVSLR
jgi:hypothetical protein